MVKALEDAEDLMRARTSSIKEMELLRWEDVADEWHDDQAPTTYTSAQCTRKCPL